MSRPTPQPLVVSLRRASDVTLPVQLATQVRDLLRRGTLPAGSRLPSSRTLAAELGVARVVVEQSYDQLQAEGWTQSRRGAGTFVTDAGVRRAAVAAPAARVTRRSDASRRLVSLDTGTPWQDPRADASWRRAWRTVALQRMPTGYPDAAGLPELREELAAYVGRRRGIACSANEILVTAGTTHAWSLVLDALPPGPVGLEDPGYRAAAAVATAAGRTLVDLPVDAEGIAVNALSGAPEDLRATYVTPAHQHPLGVTMSARRRMLLLAETARRQALVVEDDYDSEFRYDVAPLPALAALGLDRVAYLGTTSKIVQPGLRLGWLVSSAPLVADIIERRVRRHDHPSWPVQVAVLSLLREGHLDRLVRSARRVYAARSSLVTERLAGIGHPVDDVAGMYVTVRLSARQERSVVAAALRAGFVLPPLSASCRTAVRHGVVIGFGAVNEAQLRQVLDVIQAALRHA
ncbi:MAG: PLP-dependent aminotransferase family protein [Nocardioidaceae bacterium]|nr:PLP-dependent aminotransferase family protein [Nocardioidaceae bacterium]